MLIALAFLAIADLIVGVSNDAVNFLNSAIGSKALSFRTIMIVASIGITFGALFSSGLMEVARKGIFNPSEFMFNEIMIIFMAVMITDILLLDFFNTIGMPTSTTVSIVFELLGASVAMALIKINASPETAGELSQYINTTKATQIILGILLSVGIAFTIGAIIQFFTRALLSFDFQNKPKWTSVIFGGLAASAISYFILIKGLKGLSFIEEETISLIQDNTLLIVAGLILLWSIVCLIIVNVFKYNVYRFIILIGTFGLALSFAGNDLVNFIGVPIAAWQSYEAWVVSGISPESLSMEILQSKVPAPTFFLALAGVVMVVTLWLSKKARRVTETEINLARQDAGSERFSPNWLSRGIVQSFSSLSLAYNYIISNTLKDRINGQFKKPIGIPTYIKSKDAPAFDMARASVNLMVASVLISIATSLKLPLSTTYVTFMVAMGTSLTDRAWGSESAVYRVAGVINVIGGWFFTALVAFVSAGTIAFLIHLSPFIMVTVLLIVAVLLLIRNYVSHKKRLKVEATEDRLLKAESSSVQGVIHESANTLARAVKRVNRIYTNAIEGLARHNLTTLKKNRKQVNKLSDEIDDLRNNIFYFIKNLDEASVNASNFYLNILDNMRDTIQSLEYISNASHKHVNNQHKKLKFSQIKELKDLDTKLEELFSEAQSAFDSLSFEEIGRVLYRKSDMYDVVKTKIQRQVERTRSEESSPKNTTLYFSILLETKDLLDAIFDLLEAYYSAHDSSIKPAKIS